MVLGVTSRRVGIREDMDEADIPSSMSAMAESLSSHQYRSYLVNMAHKLRTNTEVQLGEQAGNVKGYLKGFRASMNPRFEGGILAFLDRIPDFVWNSIHSNVVHDYMYIEKYTGGILCWNH